MAKGTKVKIKVSGTPKQVKNALHTLTNSEPPVEKVTPIRTADFKAHQARTNNG
jgi:hypothetical protein